MENLSPKLPNSSRSQTTLTDRPAANRAQNRLSVGTVLLRTRYTGAILHCHQKLRSAVMRIRPSRSCRSLPLYPSGPTSAMGIQNSTCLAVWQLPATALIRRKESKPLRGRPCDSFLPRPLMPGPGLRPRTTSSSAVQGMLKSSYFITILRVLALKLPISPSLSKPA